MAFFVRIRTVFFWCVIGLSYSCGNGNGIVYDEGAIPPEKALSTFELEPGFKIELLAAEPLVSDPVDMEIDEQGRLYVVEMHGYPLDKGNTGRIVQLTDTDGDGKMDKSTVFIDELMFPNGIMRWKKGFIVTDAPYVYYLEDSDGDGKADIKEVLLTGFSLSNPHVNVNNPMYGLDNWIYLAHFGAIGTRNYQEEFGDLGDEIYFPKHPDAARLPKNANGRSVRFQLADKKLEMTSSRAQFGHSTDVWGRRLLANNGNHAYHEVIDNRYLERNPRLIVSDATQSISDHGDVSEVFQTTLSPDRQLFSGVGVMTSSSGVTAYTGGAFPEGFNDNVVFVAESVSNLVHADKLTDDASSFIASRMGRPNKEFLTSTDSWSRPANLYVGPDGALYVLDYYRKIIEHPEWMSDEAIQEGGLYKGRDMGRIYRVSAQDAAAPDWTKGLSLHEANTDQLVGYLSNSNSWWRMNAQRLLIDQMDEKAIPLLVQLANMGESTFGRLHARWTLAGMGAVSEEVIKIGLQDAVAGNRENAIKIAEQYLIAFPGLVNDLVALQNDKDGKVRFQLLCTLGYVADKNVAKVRNQMLFSNITDPWMQIAAFSAADLDAESLLDETLQRFNEKELAYSKVASRLAEMVSASASAAKIKNFITTAVVSPAGHSKQQSAVLQGLATGIKRNDSTTRAALQKEIPLIVNASFNHSDKAVRDASYQVAMAIGIKGDQLLRPVILRAAQVVANEKVADEKRAEALRYLQLQNDPQYIPLLQSIATSGTSSRLQAGAISTWGRVPGTAISEFIIKQWASLTPEVRDAALETFMSDTIRTHILLDAVERGAIQKTGVDRPRIVRLMSTNNDAIRIRARDLFNKDEDAEVIKAYQAALELKGDVENGKQVFMRTCATCHQKRGELGMHYGPDMGTVRNWLPKNILANILAPNLSVAAGFDLWELTTKSGERFQGLLSSESSSAVTLLIGPGVPKVFNRSEVEEMKALNTSLMPEGLAETINQQEMADLISFLRE